MNKALWAKTLRESCWLLLGGAVVLFAFQWVRVWLTSQFKMAYMAKILRHAPDVLTNFLNVPADILVTVAGRIALSYEEPVCLLIIGIWAIARGSDAVSGEISRGTMEMLLAQPVRRIELLGTNIVVMLAGLAMLCTAAWLGTWAGIHTIELETPVEAKTFLPAAFNLFSLGVFLAGFTTLLSSADQHRWRTIGIAIGFFIVELILKLVSMAAPSVEWMSYFTFLTVFEPQVLSHAFWPDVLAADPEKSWTMLWQYNGLLLGLGLAGYALASLIFCRRDLPAPL